MEFLKPHSCPAGNKFDWINLKTDDRLLLEAFERKNFQQVDVLISKGANVNVRFGEIKDSVLHYFDDVAVVMKLLNCNANVLAANRYKESPLVYACKFGRDKQIIKALLDNGAYVNKQVKYGKKMTPLTLAMENFDRSIDLETIEELLYYGANMDFGKMFTKSPFIKALTLSPDIARIMIKYSALRIWDKYRFIRMGMYQRRQLISVNNLEHLSYLDECNGEISLLKEEKFNACHSLYDICRANIYYYVDTEPNRSFFNSYKTDSLKSKYPIYWDVLFKRVDAIKRKRNELLTDLGSLQFTAKYHKTCNCSLNCRDIRLNTDCLRHIGTFLADNDIERVIKASYKLR